MNKSGSIERIIQEEEVRGARLGNRFRYGAIVFIAIAILWNAASMKGDERAIINIVALAVFVGITVLHTLVLMSNHRMAIKLFNYLTLVADYALITGVLVFWQLTESPQNAGFTLKNPTNYYYLIPLLIPAFQFRLKYILISFTLFMVIHVGTIAICLHYGIESTRQWYEYVMGEGVILADVIPTRPVLFALVALTTGLTIRRSLSMLQRLASVEAQKTLLSRYFSPELAQRLVANPDQLHSGERRYVTVLFSDIRGFTSLSENLPPEDVARMLTDYREKITDIIFRHGGMIDKFIGDAVMAVFGVPETRGPSEDARAAVECARDMITMLPDFNRSLNGISAKLDIGIGLHCGEVFAGTIGSENRLEYTVLGDTVNTASRLEGLCKLLKRRLIVSREIVEQTDPAQFESVARVRVKGRVQPIQTFTLVGFPLVTGS
ncbi:MAG: adenylate/guanylate cyclase domain-containing protein [Leptospiraceae bacterium]|nr:adenylate/guanylate cyclase domain-containing protein [Leptospiraceae bacterium]